MQNSRRKEIRKKAIVFCEQCRDNGYGIIDLFKECEHQGYKLLRYPLGENADLGFTLKKDADIIIFTNTCSRLSREIFTLAHEIGHVKLHMEFADSFIDNASTISNKSSDEKEQEANYFAACLLMPSDKVERFLDVKVDNFEEKGLSATDIARIMSEFNVSFEMALNRLEDLGKIDSAERTNLDNERNQKRVGNLLRSVGGNSRLNEAGKEIAIPYEYIDYVIYNYNHSAIPLETLNRVLECYHLSVDDVSDRLVCHSQEDEEDDIDELIGGLED